MRPYRQGVVSLPMRDGNVTYMTDVAESVIVVSLPMRDGNCRFRPRRTVPIPGC